MSLYRKTIVNRFSYHLWRDGHIKYRKPAKKIKHTKEWAKIECVDKFNLHHLHNAHIHRQVGHTCNAKTASQICWKKEISECIPRCSNEDVILGVWFFERAKQRITLSVLKCSSLYFTCTLLFIRMVHWIMVMSQY